MAFPNDECPTAVGSEELYAALGHETRLKILLVLGTLEGKIPTSVTFSTLRQHIGVSDSGKFNFHLRKLTDQFIEHTEEGYRLTYVGRLILRAILAGRHDPDRLVLEDTPTESSCYNCGTPLIANYDDGRLKLRCDNCEELSYRITMSPSALTTHDVETFLNAADRRVRSDLTLVGKGVCPACSGPTTAERRDPSTTPTENLYINHVCDQSGDRIVSNTIGELLLTQPAVVAFFYNRGIDLTAPYCWEIDFCVSDEYLTIISKEPLTVQFEYPLDDETLRATFTEDLELTDLAITTAEY